MSAFRPYKSKHEAHQSAVKWWVCLDCNQYHEQKRKVCDCGSLMVEKFDSTAEARRFSQLRLERMAGIVTDIEPHPKYLFHGPRTKKLLWSYTPDFRYRREGQLVVEDVKGSRKHVTQDFKRNMKMMKEYFDIDVQIVTPT